MEAVNILTTRMENLSTDFQKAQSDMIELQIAQMGQHISTL